MRYDAIIIGGSFAGLSAAMYLARARKSVCVLDTGAPRNRFAARSHGFFGQDGAVPKDMLRTMRQQVAHYPTVSFLAEGAAELHANVDAYSVALPSGAVVSGRRILFSFGISDIMPSTPGVAEHWGDSVIHCPYCHGYEFRDQRLGVLNMSPVSLHQAMIVADWGPTTFFLDGGDLAPADAAALARRGVEIEAEAIDRLSGTGRRLSQIHLSGGRSAPIDALFISPRHRLNSAIAAQAGCAIDDSPLGPIVKVDEMQMTSVPRLFAAGDITRVAHSVTFACADGVKAAMAMHRSLAFEVAA